jgi:hypothetical protein
LAMLDVPHVATVDVRPPGQLSKGEPGVVTKPAQLGCELLSPVAVHVASHRLLGVASVVPTLRGWHLFHLGATVGR